MDWTNHNQVPLLGMVGRAVVVPTATFTRPADTTAYAAGDLVANHVTAGSVVPMSLSVGRLAAPGGRIKNLRLAKSTTGLGNAAFRVHFFTASPVAANGDNGAFSTDQVASYQGSVAVVMDRAFTDGAWGSAAADLLFKLASGQTLYALVEASAAYSPGSAEVFTLAAAVEQD